MRLTHLSPLYERPGPWASVCVGALSASEATQSERDVAVREICRELGRQGADETTGRAVYDALTEWPGPVGAAGRAVYAAHGEVVLDPPLTAAPRVPEIHWSALPRVAPLLDLAVQEPVCLVAYIDSTGADLEIRGPRGSRPAGEVEGKDWPLQGSATADWSERHFPMSVGRHLGQAQEPDTSVQGVSAQGTRVRDVWAGGGRVREAGDGTIRDEDAGQVSAALALCQEEARADLIILVGSDRERRAVVERLPEPLRPLTVGTGYGSHARGAGARLRDTDVERARQEHLRRIEAAELDRFRVPGTPNAEGVPALVEAARDHRIAELLIRLEGPDARREVWVGAEPDQIAVHRGDTLHLGTGSAEPARADDALLRSVVVNGADVLRVHPAGGETAGDETADGRGIPAGGLAALLLPR
ncbi:hypothetical protein [Streptomyces sp. NPDC059909]|uniref:baeRF2 domain-containing protein n=1 Tax=Streptomyces sp. NPDC059909 TaxID=3346998 RepID=UPI00364C8E49